MSPTHVSPTARLATLILPLLAFTLPTTSRAWSYNGNGYGEHGYYGHGQHYSHDYGYAHRYAQNSHYYGAGTASHQYGYNAGNCHPTSKIGYFDGYQGKIGGTMCYDEYGDPYIVRGSRYLIEEY